MDTKQTVTDELFAWRNETIVLLGHRDADGWVLARSWRRGDTMTDVRRWCFATDRKFIGQVRRLVRDATDCPLTAGHAMSLADDWAARHTLACSQHRAFTAEYLRRDDEDSDLFSAS